MLIYFSEEENEHTSIHYVVGDVTHPQTKDPAVILHCVGQFP